VKERTRNRVVDEIVKVPSVHLCSIGTRAFGQRGNIIRAEHSADVLENSNELRNGNQDPGLATAIGASFFAIERRTVLVLDDANRFVGKPCHIGRYAHNGPQPDAGTKRVEGERVTRVSTGDKSA